MSMTKSDYEMVAEVLRVNQASIGNAFTKWENICFGMARTFQNDNNKFDRNKFLAACGIEQDN